MTKPMKAWKTKRNESDMVKLEQIKQEIQKTQINNNLPNTFDALLLLLIRKGVI